MGHYYGPTDRDEPVGITCPKIDNIIEILEEVRHANSKLREWGNGLVKDLEQKDNEIDSLKADIESLQGELKEACSEMNDLERELSNVQYRGE